MQAEHASTDRAKAPGKRSKKPYRSPELVAWGSVRVLTRGNFNGVEDGFLNGTQGT